METTVNEIAPDVFRISTLIPEAAPGGLSFNQFLVRDDEPFLFHTGMRQLFPLVSQALSTLIPLESLRWISFGHLEADECGAMNQFLAAAPRAAVIHGALACDLSLNDMCDRPPVAIGDEPLVTGRHRLRFIPTPHIPHNWESGLWFDEAGGTLFCGDIFTSLGPSDALTTTDRVAGAIEAEQMFHATALTPSVSTTLHALADLGPSTLAIMHGPSFTGDGAGQLLGLAAAYDTLRTTPV